jgi:hypothetical protein
MTAVQTLRAQAKAKGNLQSTSQFTVVQLYGMYLFGYGNFVSSARVIGVTLSRHISINTGYQLA